MVYAVGSVLLLLDMPQIPLTVIWLPCMGFLAFRMYRILKEEGYALFQRNIAIITIILAVLFGTGSFLGFANLSIFLCMVWFFLTVSFQFGGAFSLLLRRLVEERTQLGGVARSLILGFAIPSAWLFIISLSLFWMTNQIVDITLFLNAATHTFNPFWDVSFSVASLIFSLFLYFVLRTALRALYVAMDKSCSEEGERSGVLGPFKSLIATLSWMFYAILVLHIFGINLSHLGMVIGGLSVGIGFGMQHFVNNLVSGLILIFGRDIREGDIIEMGGVWAKIERISMRATQACTVENAMISIPNSTLLNSQVTNWTLNNRHVRKEIKITLAFGSDSDLACEALMKIVCSQSDVMKIPHPEVFISSVGPASTELTIRIWIIDIEKVHKVLSDINKAIEMAFEENRTRIAFPGNAGFLVPKERRA